MAVTATNLQTHYPGLPFPARVQGISVEDSVLDVIDDDGDGRRCARAQALRIAGWAPAVGDRVLVVAGEGGLLYVLGPLAAPSRRVLDLAGGGCAEQDPESRQLMVRNAQGDVLFRFTPSVGAGTLHLESTATALAVSCRDIRLDAADELRLSGRRVTVEGAESVRLGVAAADGHLPAGLRIDRHEIALSAGHLLVQARSSVARIARMDWLGRLWQGRVERACLHAERLETSAETVIHNARDVYLRVRGLHQLTATRLRQIVSDTIQIKARRVLQRASDAYKVRSDKIHLG
ncbi:MAG: DUF3540 domain-containing protein [Aquisalimonadaceae bacterium]